MDVFEVYVKVWRRAEADGVFVHYRGWPDESLAGYFHPRDNFGRPMKPEIAIRRPYYKELDGPHRDSNAPPHLPQPDLVLELFTLAHEYGHSRSWAGRTARDDHKLYQAAANRRDEVTAEEKAKLPAGLSKEDWNERLRTAVHARLDDDARDRIMREEMLAWEIGREVLTEYGYDDIAAYDETAKRHLHNHRYRLRLDDAWPVDTPEMITE